MSALAKNYNRRKIAFKRGKGSFLYSTNGKKYLDFVQGIAVNSLGHAHPQLVKTINQQSIKYKLFIKHAIIYHIFHIFNILCNNKFFQL